MNPKKYKEFKEGIAEELQIHPDVVDDFIAFYYNEVRKSLSSLSATHIWVQGLGTFSMKKAKLEKSIKKKKSLLGNFNKMAYNGIEKSMAIKEQLELQEKALEMLNESIQKKKEFKEKKNGSK
jgi:nucleoid DNA-binding protein